MEYQSLNTGYRMPMIGYGVYQIPPRECTRCVLDALEVGYRHIDTAQAYFNEAEVGEAIATSGIPREDIFLTTKVWISNAGEEKAYASILESLKKLKTGYIDLLLIHQPFGDYYGTYRAMQKAQREGLVKSYGVSNFLPDRFVDLVECTGIAPAVNQIESHIFNQQTKARNICARYGTAIQAWAPFAEGKRNLFRNPVLAKIGKEYGKSNAQVALRFLLQLGLTVLPKSVHKARMVENFDVFNFSLSTEDMKAIAALDGDETLFLPHTDPDTAKFLIDYMRTQRPD